VLPASCPKNDGMSRTFARAQQKGLPKPDFHELTVGLSAGSRGFLKVIDDRTLGFADFGGNRQYVTLGNLSENLKALVKLTGDRRWRRCRSRKCSR
jgi:predicted pyridoxine 5'-phosphate oxidase superfamily flavin-nucleotide-binding protein